MKKFTALFVFSLITSLAFSQVNFFAEGGINLTRPNNNNRQKGAAAISSRTGYVAILGFVSKMGNRFGLNNRLSYLSKVYHESYFVGPDFSGTNDYTITALKDQLVLEYILAGKKDFQLSPFAGAYATLHVGGIKDYRESFFAGVFEGSRKLNFGRFGDFNNWEAGLTTGFRAQWKSISFTAITDIGLTKVHYNDNVKWIAGQFVIGYFLR